MSVGFCAELYEPEVGPNGRPLCASDFYEAECSSTYPAYPDVPLHRRHSHRPAHRWKAVSEQIAEPEPVEQQVEPAYGTLVLVPRPAKTKPAFRPRVSFELGDFAPKNQQGSEKDFGEKDFEASVMETLLFVNGACEDKEEQAEAERIEVEIRALARAIRKLLKNITRDRKANAPLPLTLFGGEFDVEWER